MANSGGESRPRRQFLATAVALSALAVSLVGFAFAVVPSLKPDPQTENTAEVDVVAVDHGVTVDDWLRQRARSGESYRRVRDEFLDTGPGPKLHAADAEGILTLEGLVARVACTVRGFKDRSVKLRWSLYDARKQRRVDNENFGSVPAMRVKLDTPNDRVVALAWVPEPPRRSKYFIRAELYDDGDGTQLAVGDSKAFTAP